MRVILDLINRADRKTVYYDGSRISGYIARQARGRARVKARATAAAKVAAAAKKAAALAAYRKQFASGSVKAQVGRYRGRSQGSFKYNPKQHTAAAKSSRRSARVSEARRLTIKKYGRYSQLM